MNSLLTPTAPTSLVTPPYLAPHRFTVEEYYRMADLGLLGPDARVELLDGVIVDRNAMVAPHAFAVDELFHQVLGLRPQGWMARGGKPISLPGSAPEPDVAVMRGARSDYRRRHPEAADIGLLIEVAESTLATDRGIKSEIYARAGIPEYWIVNLVDRQIEVYCHPQPPTAAAVAHYADCRIVPETDRVELRIGGSRVGEIAVADLL